MIRTDDLPSVLQFRAVILARRAPEEGWTFEAHEMGEDPLVLAVPESGEAEALFYRRSLEELSIDAGSLALDPRDDQDHCPLDTPDQVHAIELGSDGVRFGAAKPASAAAAGARIAKRRDACATTCSRFEKLKVDETVVLPTTCRVGFLIATRDVINTVIASTNDGFLHRVGQSSSSTIAHVPGAVMGVCRGPWFSAAVEKPDGSGYWLIAADWSVHEIASPWAATSSVATPDGLHSYISTAVAIDHVLVGATYRGEVWVRDLGEHGSKWREVLLVPGPDPAKVLRKRSLFALDERHVLFSAWSSTVARIDLERGTAEPVLRAPSPFIVADLVPSPARLFTTMQQPEDRRMDRTQLLSVNDDLSTVSLAPEPPLPALIATIFPATWGALAFTNRGEVLLWREEGGFCSQPVDGVPRPKLLDAFNSGRVSYIVHAGAGRYAFATDYGTGDGERVGVDWFSWDPP